jgi:type I restriction enzyme S subunit
VIANLKPYAAYKESGLTWLPELPDHWQVQRSKYLFREVDQRSTDGSEQRLSMSQRHGLIPSSQVEERRLVAESNVGGKVCQPGDLVLNRLKAHLGVLAVSPSHGVVSPDYTVLRPLGTTNHRYFCEVYRSPYCGQELRQRAKGIVEGFWRLYTDDFYDIRVPLPPPEEQAAIVRFLGWANGQLERAIRAKRKVIALLNEQKQAIIHRAVTRGSDPSVPLKPSGIAWLGDIPQHWEVRPLKAVCKVQSGITLGKDYATQVTNEYAYLRVANVQAGQVNLDLVKTIRAPKSEAMRCRLQDGDVLMTEGGDPDKLGRGCVWQGQIVPCLHQNHVFAVRPDRKCLEPSYLSALLGTRYARDYFESTAKQTTNLASTNKTKIGQFLVLLPSVEQQRLIMAALTKELLPVDGAISRFEREIILLREYRTRLIADVVTGQLDVREAATLVPDDVPLSDLADAPDDIDDPETADEEAIS